ncbi:MAG: hypothetical protein H6540_05770 [Bacteroidales bacterium]|nr:hypothetical protein [Bacteroidales bacterium]MCB9013674.1 hypothetical protein [Bacteroidales bacterium]
MKNLIIALLFISALVLVNCKKENSERFNLLTGSIWVSDSLLADGQDASGPGGFLEKFKGEAHFNTDGKGVFGVYTGTWTLIKDDTEIIIKADSLAFPLTTEIVELSKISLKITTSVPNKVNPSQNVAIRMTFKAK